MKASAAAADELVRPVGELRGVIVQRAARTGVEDAQEAAVFLLERGCLYGPERLSTLGVRAVKEQTSVGSSLFAQPLMLAAVPLGAGSGPGSGPGSGENESAADSPEVRAAGVLGRLQARVRPELDVAAMGDHLSLLRRWYYRPENQRVGEIFLPNADGSWPLRRILRGAARMALGEPKAMAETRRDLLPGAAAELKTKILHEGREGVERVVADVGPRRGRRRKGSEAGSAGGSSNS